MEDLLKADKTVYLQEDQQQANWELIVEGAVYGQGVVLEPYGNSAGCNDESSRVLYPLKHPIHQLICVSSNDKAVFDFLNERNVDFQDGPAVFDLNVISWSCVHFLDASSIDALKREIDEKKIFLAELDAAFIRDDARLFSCLSVVLEFPDYFGEN